jgi:hypothetical protein
MENIFQLQAKDAILRINNTDCLNAVQGFNWEPTMNEEYKEELGNEGYAAQSAEPEVAGSFDVTATGATVTFLNRMIKNVDGTGEFLGYRGTTNEGLITESDLEFAQFDLILAKKANEIFTRSELLERMYLSSLSISANADGDASETYNFEGELGEVYRGAMRDLLSVPVTRASDTTLTIPAPYTVDTAADVNAGADWRIHHVDVDGERHMDTELTVAGQTITLTDGYVRRGVKLSVVIFRKAPGQFPTIVAATSARFIRANKVSLYLVDKADVDIEALLAAGTHTLVSNHNNLKTEIDLSGEEVLRVQSADISVDLQREALRQLLNNDRGTSVYYRSATFPLPITSSLSSLETDLKDWQKIEGASDTDVLTIKGFEGRQFQIVLRYFYEDKCVQATTLLDAQVTGRGSSVSVGGRAEVSWGFTGSKLRIEGTDF